jgi:hypothetical protein
MSQRETWSEYSGPIARHWLLGIAIVVGGLSTILVACGGGGSDQEDSASFLTVATEDGEEVYFPRQRPTEEPRGVPEALAEGELILADGCLRLRQDSSDPGLVPIWPLGFTPRAGDNRIQVLDEEGRVVATVGERMEIGGGFIDTLEDSDGSEGELANELSERCPGPYWLVGEV